MSELRQCQIIINYANIISKHIFICKILRLIYFLLYFNNFVVTVEEVSDCRVCILIFDI